MKAEIIVPPPVQTEVHVWMTKDKAKTLLHLIGATSRADRIRMWKLIDTHKTISDDDTEVLSELYLAILKAGVESE